MQTKLPLSVLHVLLLASSIFGQAPHNVTILKDGDTPVVSMKFSPDGRSLTRICMYGMPMIFDTEGYTKIRSFNIGMRMISFSPDGKLIVTAEGTDGMRLWNAAEHGKQIAVERRTTYQINILETPYKVLMAPTKIDSMRVRTAEFSPDGNFMVNTFAGGKIRIWNTKTWENPEDIYLNNSPVTAYNFTPDSENLMVGFASGEIFILNLQNKKITTAKKAAGGVTGIEISRHGNQVITSHISNNTQYSKGPFVMVWKKIDQSGSFGTPIFNSGKASLSPDGKLLALGGDTLKILSMADMKMVMAWKLPEMSILETKTVPERYTQSPDYEKQKEKVEKKLPSRITELSFSPDSKTLAVGTMLGTILVYNIEEL